MITPAARAQGARYLVLALATALILFPIVWIITTAFKGPGEINAIPPTLLPHRATLGNFQEAIQTDFLLALRNSLIVALSSTLLAMLLSVPAAYAFARYRFPGSRILLFGILMIRMIPGISLILPFFRMMSSVGLLNTYAGLIITYLSFQVPFAIWLLEGFFRALSREIVEAALIDGCSRLRAFTRVMLPLAATGMATAAIFCFLMSWNEFLYAVTLTRTLVAKTGPVAISEAVSSYQIFWGRMAASATFYILPVVAFNVIFQRFIVRGLTLGAVKG